MGDGYGRAQSQVEQWCPLGYIKLWLSLPVDLNAIVIKITWLVDHQQVEAITSSESQKISKSYIYDFVVTCFTLLKIIDTTLFQNILIEKATFNIDPPLHRTRIRNFVDIYDRNKITRPLITSCRTFTPIPKRLLDVAATKCGRNLIEYKVVYFSLISHDGHRAWIEYLRWRRSVPPHERAVVKDNGSIVRKYYYETNEKKIESDLYDVKLSQWSRGRVVRLLFCVRI